MHLKLTRTQYGSILKLDAILEIGLVSLYAWWWPSQHQNKTNVDTIVSILFYFVFQEYCCVDCHNYTIYRIVQPFEYLLHAEATIYKHVKGQFLNIIFFEVISIHYLVNRSRNMRNLLYFPKNFLESLYVYLILKLIIFWGTNLLLKN
jgi:hypothetical protein